MPSCAPLRTSMTRLKRRFTLQAFSLVELLAVMAIIVIMISLAVPAFTHIAQGSTLERAGNLVVGQLDLARQTALASSRKVEVRFYKHITPGAPGTEAWRAIQLFDVANSGVKKPMGNAIAFPDPVVIGEQPTLSTLMNLPADYELAAADRTANPLPSIGTSYTGIAFRFSPSGSVDLPDVTANYYMTLFSENTPATASAPPANYFTIQLDPVNGRARNYRP